MSILKPNYNDSIVNVSNSILKRFNVKNYHSTIKELDTILLNHKKVVLILLDGMGANIINHHLQDNDFLKKNMFKTITSVFPPTTVAATNSVLRAKVPYETGYVGWVQYFEQEDIHNIVFMNRDFYNDKKIVPNDLTEQYLKQPDIFDLLKEINPEMSINKIFPSFIEEGFETFDEQLVHLKTITDKNETSFSYVYWVEPDLTEHVQGIKSEQTKNMLRSLNNSLTNYAKSLDDDTVVVVIADHGLTDVEEINLMDFKDITSTLKRLPSIEPRATAFDIKNGLEGEFKDAFNKHFSGKYQLFTKSEFKESGLIGIGKKHPYLDSFLGDYMALAIDKYMFKLNDHKTYKSHHAGLLKDEMEVPLVIYTKKQ
ncbi:hypothetical protein CI105_05365 [Candidatus Izimaplasma bacterium ZiA1]|uniref:alkaline phosphatase family protein n=1 Tax=Candidatus Izimoplasma sp. ZiA1 TaxID=2024899 RepID=UPI000BAA8C05|nr:hypothetical protein CI105_05365 [Candidatus Izimaplasma bacterium ZiA1]